MPEPSLPYPDFVKIVKDRARSEGFELTPQALAELASRAGYSTMGASAPYGAMQEKRNIASMQAAPQLSSAEQEQAKLIEALAPTRQRSNFPRDEQFVRDKTPNVIEQYAPDTLEAAGALAGAAIGQGKTGGRLAMLGAATGRVGGKAIESIERGRRYGQTPLEAATAGPNTPKDIAMGLQRAGKEAASAALFEAIPIVGAYAPSLARKGFYKAMGALSDDAVRKAEVANRVGVPLGITDISDYAIVQGVPRMFGSFPVIGGPIQKHAGQQAKSIVKSMRGIPAQVAGEDRLWVRMGPVVGLADSGRMVVDSSQSAFKLYKGRANAKYEYAKHLARKHGASVPTHRVQVEMQDLLQQTLDARAATKAGKKVPAGSATAFSRKFVRTYQDVVDELDVEQWDAMATQLDSLIEQAKNAKGHGYDMRLLVQMKKSMEADFAHMNAPKHVLKAFNDADQFVKESMDIFDSSTGRKFGRINKRAFKLGFEEQGTRTKDELYQVAFNAKSADAITELRNIVVKDPVRGRAVWRQLVASHLDDVIETSIKPTLKAGPVDEPLELVKYDQIRNAIGLSNTKSQEYQALKAMLKDTGVRPKDIEHFLRSASRAFPQGLPNVAEMARRRTVLGGLKSGARTMLPFAQRHAPKAAGAAGTAHAVFSPTSAVMMSLILRQFGKVVTNPRGMRAAIELSKPGLSQAQRTAAARRLQVAIPTIFAVEEGASQAGTAAVDAAAPYLEGAQRGANAIFNPWGALLQE